jgi:phosphopantothenoylcysteine decarboxylase/phosphopantothenate--cysteine ligase
MHGKTILLGVSGSIAAYKACELASRLTQSGAIVPVVLTSGAQKFVSPLTFQALTRQPVHSSLWPQDSSGESGVTAAMAHIGLAEKADAILIAPASANCIARLAHGLSDDLLTTLVLAARCPILIAPAMNPAMLEHPATQNNLEILRGFGYQLIDPESGRMACEHIGQGRLPETEVSIAHLQRVLAPTPQTLAGKTVLITAGPTREMLDPVRYLTNRSSGKMGYALAQAAQERGARVVLISGPTQLKAPGGVQVENVITTQEMHDAAMRHAPSCDVIIASAAPADYRPAQIAAQKIKKQGTQNLTLDLVPTPDIIAAVGAQKRAGQIIIAFAAETENLTHEARRKMQAKNADAIVANDITQEGAGFDVSTNRVTWIMQNDEETWPLLSKKEVAARILDKVATTFLRDATL